MALFVTVVKEDQTEFRIRELPLVVDDTLTLIIQFDDPCCNLSNQLAMRNRELVEFREKYQLLSEEELSIAITITSRDLFQSFSQLFTCVGCRRSGERLFYQLLESRHPSLSPLLITSDADVTITANFAKSYRNLGSMFYKHGCRVKGVVDSIPTGKKNKRCALHSLESQRYKPACNWLDVWRIMTPDCQEEVNIIEDEPLLDTLETYLKKHRFCTECKCKVMQAYNILIGKVDSTKEKGYVPSLYQGLRSCVAERHVHVNTEADFMTSLIDRAEPEIHGSRRERHAKTLEIAQEEVLTCIGMCLFERLHRVHQLLKEEEQTWKMLLFSGIDALKKKFETGVEKKRGISQLELFYEQVKREESARELRKQQKRERKRQKRLMLREEGEDSDGKEEECDDEEEEEEDPVDSDGYESDEHLSIHKFKAMTLEQTTVAKKNSCTKKSEISKQSTAVKREQEENEEQVHTCHLATTKNRQSKRANQKAVSAQLGTNHLNNKAKGKTVSMQQPMKTTESDCQCMTDTKPGSKSARGCCSSAISTSSAAGGIGNSGYFNSPKGLANAVRGKREQGFQHQSPNVSPISSSNSDKSCNNCDSKSGANVWCSDCGYYSATSNECASSCSSSDNCEVGVSGNLCCDHDDTSKLHCGVNSNFKDSRAKNTTYQKRNLSSRNVQQQQLLQNKKTGKSIVSKTEKALPSLKLEKPAPPIGKKERQTGRNASGGGGSRSNRNSSYGGLYSLQDMLEQNGTTAEGDDEQGITQEEIQAARAKLGRHLSDNRQKLREVLRQRFANLQQVGGGSRCVVRCDAEMAPAGVVSKQQKSSTSNKIYKK